LAAPKTPVVGCFAAEVLYLGDLVRLDQPVAMISAVNGKLADISGEPVKQWLARDRGGVIANRGQAIGCNHQCKQSFSLSRPQAHKKRADRLIRLNEWPSKMKDDFYSQQFVTASLFSPKDSKDNDVFGAKVPQINSLRSKKWELKILNIDTCGKPATHLR